MNVGSGLWYQMDLTSATRATNSISLWAMQITKLLASFLKPFPLRFSHCTLWSCPLTDTAATTWWARWWWRWRAWTSPTLRAALSHWSERSPQGIQGWQWEVWVAHIEKEGCTPRNPENKMSKTQERQASKPGERRAPGLALPSGFFCVFLPSVFFLPSGFLFCFFCHQVFLVFFAIRFFVCFFAIRFFLPSGFFVLFFCHQVFLFVFFAIRFFCFFLVTTFNWEKSLIIWCSCSAWCKPDHSGRAESEKPPKNGHHRSLRWDKPKTLHSILG